MMETYKKIVCSLQNSRKMQIPQVGSNTTVLQPEYCIEPSCIIADSAGSVL